MTERIRPFSNGEDDRRYCAVNCDRCTKIDYGRGKSHCDIFDAMTLAYWDDGTIPHEVADRAGLLPEQDGACRELELPETPAGGQDESG